MIEEGSEGQGDGQGGHLLLQHSTHTPVTVHQAWGENTDEMVHGAWRKASQKQGGALRPAVPPSTAPMTLTSKHHVGLGQSQVVTEGEGCVL